MASWQRDFASGLIILVPLLVTIIFLAWIYSHLASVPIPLDPAPLRVLLTLIIFVLMVFSVGYLMRTALGAVLESALDDLMNQLPGLRVIYNASKMAVETALSGTDELQKPVRLEVWEGLRMTAFKTGNTAPDGREILFLPTAPNITTGFVIEVEEDRYTEAEDSVEDALTRLLSAGFGDNDEQAVAGMFGVPEEDRPDEVGVTEITGDLSDGSRSDTDREVSYVSPDDTDDGKAPDDSNTASPGDEETSAQAANTGNAKNPDATTTPEGTNTPEKTTQSEDATNPDENA